jgi:hypothetical protein
MLLRRVIEHVREQNWFAVGIDFVIVVIGVFVGIQVSNWNEERGTRQRGDEFTERLRADLRGERWLFDFMVEYYRDVHEASVRAVEALTGKTERSNHDLLVDAYRATQYREGVRQRATYDELLSTGSLGLISDRALLAIAARVYRMPSIDNMVQEGLESPYRRAFRASVDNDVQRELSRRCGDRYIAPGDFDGIGTVQGYPCSLELPQHAIDAAADALRADPKLIGHLRQRVADLETRQGDMTSNNRDVFDGLRDLAAEEP